MNEHDDRTNTSEPFDEEMISYPLIPFVRILILTVILATVFGLASGWWIWG